MRDDPEVRQIAAEFSLGIPRQTASGRSGDLLGRGTGSSLEFQEYREYLPGDDLRHVDWAAYARSDALMVRLYREEVSPCVEVILDTSASMATADSKTGTAAKLAAVFSLQSAAAGGDPVIWLAGDSVPPDCVRLDSLDRLRQVRFEAASDLLQLMENGGVPLRRQAVRIVISDFLFRVDPQQLISRLSRDAAELWLVQVLSSWERQPQEATGARLIDAESGEETHVVLNPSTIDAYRRRLGQLQRDLRMQCTCAGGRFAVLDADQELRRSCREVLAPAGILTTGRV